MHNLAPEELKVITRSVMLILDNWGLESEQIVAVLGLSSGTRKRQLDKYRSSQAFPVDANLLKRLEHIIGISDALRTTFPRNINMSEKWMKTEHRRFDNETPLKVILEQGIDGLCKVRAELDCTFAWNTSVDK